MHSRTLLALPLLLLVLITQSGFILGPNTFREDRLYGWWTGQTEALYGPDTESRWLINYRSDNTFSARFKIFQGGQLVSSNENYGAWRIERNILYLMHEGSIENGVDDRYETPNADPYRIIALEPDRFVYELMSINFEFTARRADSATNF